MRRRFWSLLLLAVAIHVAASVDVRASNEPIETAEWLAEPTWKSPTTPIPRITPPPRRELQPEPIPLPPAVFAVAGPALVTFALARLSVRRKPRRARPLRG